MRIIDYLPESLYSPVLEMQRVSEAEGREIAVINEEGFRLFCNTFVKLADLEGIERFEVLLGIEADPANETIEFRRQRILIRLSSFIPFTERYLISLVDSIIGEGNWTYTLDHNNYWLLIEGLIPGSRWVKELEYMLKIVLPANLGMTLTPYQRTWDSVYVDDRTWRKELNYYADWQQVLDTLMGERYPWGTVFHNGKSWEAVLSEYADWREVLKELKENRYIWEMYANEWSWKDARGHYADWRDILERNEKKWLLT